MLSGKKLSYSKTVVDQLFIFLKSEQSFALNLTGNEWFLLVIIFDFMDSNSTQECFADQAKLGKLARISESTLTRALKKFYQYGLLDKRKVWKENYYFAGPTIKNFIEQN